MATFGGFETVREIHRMGNIALYSGRSREDDKADFAIKVFHPPHALLEEEWVRTDNRNFLKSAELQKRVADSGARHWAPIHEVGSAPEGSPGSEGSSVTAGGPPSGTTTGCPGMTRGSPG